MDQADLRARKRKQIVTVLFVLSFLVLATIPASGVWRNETDLSESPSSQSGITIPFELRGTFLITVEARIGFADPLRFVLDSGTTHSMVDTKVARRLGLEQKEGKETAVNLDRKVAVWWVVLPTLIVGPLQETNMRVMVGDLNQVTQNGDEIDGVVGLDLLRKARTLRIDFNQQTVTLWARDKDAEASLVAHALVTPLTLGKHRLEVVVDTGACDLLLYEQRLWRYVPANELKRISKPGQQGRLQGKTVILPELRLGGDEVKATTFLIPGEAPSDLFDGYLGLCALHARVLEFDFEKNSLAILQGGSPFEMETGQRMAAQH